MTDNRRAEFEKFAKEQGYGAPWNEGDACPDWPSLSRNACWAWTAWQEALRLCAAQKAGHDKGGEISVVGHGELRLMLVSEFNRMQKDESSDAEPWQPHDYACEAVRLLAPYRTTGPVSCGDAWIKYSTEILMYSAGEKAESPNEWDRLQEAFDAGFKSAGGQNE